MQIIETGLSGCFIIEPRVFADERGYFFESFNAKTFKEKTGLSTAFVQDNESKSNYGVIRGLHFQTGAFAQAKLVRVTRGSVLDVAVDIRQDSPTYLQHIAVELSDTNKRQLFIPHGFAHGFAVLEDDTQFNYKCDNYYDKASEGGLYYNDPKLAIDWKIPADKQIISEKDMALPHIV
jgi:dTDP-4-dehydrorhamnose 3,5-epimerase